MTATLLWSRRGMSVTSLTPVPTETEACHAVTLFFPPLSGQDNWYECTVSVFNGLLDVQLPVWWSTVGAVNPQIVSPICGRLVTELNKHSKRPHVTRCYRIYRVSFSQISLSVQTGESWSSRFVDKHCAAALVHAWGRRQSAWTQWHLSSPARASRPQGDNYVGRGKKKLK